MSNIESINGGGGGLCSSMGGEDCAEYKNLAFLLVSLGITVILVGALFYYVRQRFEVLEISHKEQIGVMRNFISSIGEQFQRMSLTHHSQGGGAGAGAGAGAGGAIAHHGANIVHIQDRKQNQNQMQECHEDRISVSDNSNSDSNTSGDDYDDDSDSSDTDIIFCNDGDDASNDHPNLHINELSDIKIIELCTNDNTSTAHEAGQDSDGSDGNDDIDDSDDSDDSDGSDASDASDDRHIGDDANDANTKRLIVIKADSIVLKDDADDTDDANTRTHTRDRNMVIDLDLDMVDLSSLDSNAGAVSAVATATTATANTTPSYAQMSIKQLRQSVKRMNEHKHLDTSKLKRDQLIAMLG